MAHFTQISISSYFPFMPCFARHTCITNCIWVNLLTGLRLTVVTHLSNFFVFRPVLTPLATNNGTATYLIKIQNPYEIHIRWKYSNYSDRHKLF